jgi:DNA-binding winged helix-turn-helix (wHTH) protein
MLYTFETYVLDTRRQELRQQGVPVPLERKAYQVLLYLQQHADRLVPLPASRHGETSTGCWRTITLSSLSALT